MLKRFLSAILLNLLFFGTSYAALHAPAGHDATDPAAACNPNPSPDDLVLPMPNGIRMVFKAVPVSAGDLLYDMKFSMGINEDSAEQNVYDKRVDAYISAPFLFENMSDAWKSRIKTKDKGLVYYFIGKYEVTNAQWNAIMGDDHDSKEKPNAPATNISWYDMQEFFHRYNMWLMKNHGQSLPSIDGIPAYLRLPTEEEWEYAARGGNLPPERLNFDNFPLENGKKIADYAVYGSAYTAPAPIGSKNPNTLDLYDMAGNVSELVSSSFHFVISVMSGKNMVRRMHGSTGGLVSKGGSFLSSEEREVYPGRRVESRMFKKDENSSDMVPFAARSMGFRAVIGMLNVPSPQRYAEIGRKANQSRPAPSAKPSIQEDRNTDPSSRASDRPAAKPSPQKSPREGIVMVDPQGDPLVELDKIYQSTSSPIIKSNLAQLRELLSDRQSALHRNQDDNLTNTIRSALYNAESLRNMAFRCYHIAEVYEKSEGMLSETDKQQTKKRIMEYFGVLDSSTKFYMQSLVSIANYSIEDIFNKIDSIETEYRNDDILCRHMRDNIDKLKKHLSTMNSNGQGSIRNTTIWTDLIPQKQYEMISKYL